MQSLFSKIFLAFFLTHILASVLVYGLLTATRPEPRTPRSGGAPGIGRGGEARPMRGTARRRATPL